MVTPIAVPISILLPSARAQNHDDKQGNNDEQKSEVDPGDYEFHATTRR